MCKIPIEGENAVNPIVWASDVAGKSKQAEIMSIALKLGPMPARKNNSH